MIKLTKEEKRNLEEETWNEIMFMVVELQLKTKRLYRFSVECEPVESDCPAKLLVESPKFKWEVIQEV